MKMAGKSQGLRVWQKLITMILFAFVLVVFADGFKTVCRAESGTTNNAVNMRKTPSKNGELVKKLEKGTTVEIISQVDGKDGDGKKWYEVSVGGSNGYIRSDLVNKGAATTTSDGGDGGATGVIEQVTPVGATISGSNTVRVRTSASTSTSNNILSTVNKGTEVTVIGKTVGSDKKTWYQVKLQVDGKDVVGYVRSDYLALTGEIKPLEAETTTPPPADTETQTPVEPEKKPEEVEAKKRYETKLINEEWWILDYEKSEQYKIEQLFSAADEYKNLYETEKKKAKSSKGWLVFLVILVLALCAAVAYLFYRFKESKEEAFIASIENNTPRRTAERPRGEDRANREKPAIKDGLEPRGKDEEGRPSNGQRTTANRQPGQRPAQGQQPGQRPTQGQQPGQRPAQGQQPGQRPAQGQQPGQRPVQGQQPGQRPVQGQQPGQRPMQGQQPGQRPMQQQPAQRPAQPQENPQQQVAARPKNFVQDNDDMEYEFLNWDSDE